MVFKKVKISILSIITIALVVLEFFGNMPEYFLYTFKSKLFKEIILEICDFIAMLKLFDKKYLFVISIILTAVWILTIMSRFVKEDLVGNINEEESFEDIHVFTHSTFKHSQFKLEENLNPVIDGEFSAIDEVPDINDDDFTGKMNCLVYRQDLEIKKFSNKMNSNFKYGYLGISHTPLIVRAGNVLGDGIKLVPFHKKRGYDFYSILNKDTDFPKLKIKKEYINSESNELIVTIATSFEIQEYQIEEFDINNKSLIMFESEKLGVDIILSEVQLEEYVEYILIKIRELIKNNNIQRTHFCISSSVFLQFFLGQRLSNTYDREIIIYHFNAPKSEEYNHVYYPWGIKLFSDSMDCTINKLKEK